MIEPVLQLPSLCLVIISHERPKHLTSLISSLSNITNFALDGNFSIFCSDNSVKNIDRIADICKFYSIPCRQNPGVTQCENFQFALEFTRDFTYFMMVHDDDLVFIDSVQLLLKSLKDEKIYFADCWNIQDSPSFVLRRHLTSLHEVNLPWISLLFPYKLPFFPSIIYPARAADIIGDINSNRNLRLLYGKYSDAYLLMKLSLFFDFDSFPQQNIKYFYRIHPSQDSAKIQICSRLNLYLFYVLNSNYSNLISAFLHILKSFLFLLLYTIKPFANYIITVIVGYFAIGVGKKG